MKQFISYKNLQSLKPLQWDENLYHSFWAHIDDIGPKGLCLYQSSDGTEPEDRIVKYGNYVDFLAENIDFGPNDAMDVIISLILDDGEEERPHRENIFRPEHRKVGIACSPHKTVFQMCVMDFVDDFLPLNSGKEIIQKHKNNEPYLVICKTFEKDEEISNNQLLGSNAVNSNGILNNQGSNNEIDQLTFKTINIINNKKIIRKKVEVVTKITYSYEDGSTKVVT